MLICFDNPIMNFQFSGFFCFFQETYHITNDKELFQALDETNENISDLQSDIDADSGTDDDEYDDPEPNQVSSNPEPQPQQR